MSHNYFVNANIQANTSSVTIIHDSEEDTSNDEDDTESRHLLQNDTSSSEPNSDNELPDRVTAACSIPPQQILEINPSPVVENPSDFKSTKTNSKQSLKSATDKSSSLQTLYRQEAYNEIKNAFEFAGPWSNYEIHPDDLLKVSNPDSIHTLLNTEILEELAPIERRLMVAGQKFTVINNSSSHMSLCRAVSQAVTGTEIHFTKVHNDIFSEIISSWTEYFQDIMDEAKDYSVFLRHYNIEEPEEFINAYKKNYFNSDSEPASIIHLLAASRKYEFNCILIDMNAEGENETAVVYNFNEGDVFKNNPDRIYHFLKSGLMNNWHYEFIVPIGSPQHINDGCYAITMFDVLLVDKQFERNEGVQAETHYMRSKNELTEQPPIFFGLGHKVYCYLPTTTNDLWSIISEVLFGKLSSATLLYKAGHYAKEQETRYNYENLKRKQEFKGGSRLNILKRLFEESVRAYNHKQGSIVDLEHVANLFEFTFTLIGLNHCGNFFWKESCKEEPSKRGGAGGVFPRIELFVKVSKNNENYCWYAFQDAGWECPMQRIVENKDIQTTSRINDEDAYWQVHYCRTEPCIKFRNEISAVSKAGLKFSKILTGSKMLAKGVTFVSKIVLSVITKTNKRFKKILVQHVLPVAVSVLPDPEPHLKRVRAWVAPFRGRRVHPEPNTYESDTQLQILFQKSYP